MEILIPSLDLLIVAPEIVVLVTALLVMMADLVLVGEQKTRLAWLALVGVGAAAGVSCTLWDGSDPTLQGMLAADGYALFLNLVLLAAAALAILLSLDTHLPRGETYALLLLSTAGMMLMAAAVSLITIFLALEILSLALYVLVGLDRADGRSAEAALKYFLLGAFASGFLLYGMALTYGQAGTASLTGVRDHMFSLDGSFPPLLAVGLGLMVTGFGFKVALVPFQMWTPDVYEGAPTPITAFMSVGAKTAGFAALGRVVLYAFGQQHESWSWLLAALAALTMTVGNLAALRQANLKRLLAYSSIAHAGYILVGLAAGNEAGTGAVLFYLFVYAFMNLGAFAVILACERLAAPPGRGEAVADLAVLAGGRRWPAVAMALFMLSLAGVPPLAGFLGKLYIFSAAVQGGLAWLAAVGVVNSVVSATYYLRVVAAMAWPERVPVTPAGIRVPWGLQAVVALAALAVVVLGLWPGPVVDLARLAAAAIWGG
jgi:NADH-quinone oxidoreductase subunit N